MLRCPITAIVALGAAGVNETDRALLQYGADCTIPDVVKWSYSTAAFVGWKATPDDGVADRLRQGG